MTLLEVMVMLTVITFLAVTVSSAISNRIHKAKLASCFSDMRSIQSALVKAGALTSSPPVPTDFWDQFWDSRPPGPYVYIPDLEDSNGGQGSDLDGLDERNERKASWSEKKDIRFVVLCRHDHGGLAKYIYVVDEEPPTIAAGLHDPQWDRFLKGGDRGTKEVPGR